MKKCILTLVFFGVMILFFSCSKNEGEVLVNDFGGYYKIKSISSNIPIDMNNDGIKSTDYLQEVKSDYILFNGEVMNFGYDNELRHNFAEARPTKYQSTNAKYLDIRFPIQKIDSIYQGGNNFITLNMEYIKIPTFLSYSLSQNNVEIDSDLYNYDQLEFYNVRNFEIQRISKNEFQIKFDYLVYDFFQNDWIDTNLTAEYIKVD